MGAATVIAAVAVTSGREVPSARFRVRQYTSLLADRGVLVREATPRLSAYAPNPLSDSWVPGVLGSGAWAACRLATRLPGLARSWFGDVTWLERALLPGHPTAEPMLRRPLVLDVDDAIWLRAPRGRDQVRATARRTSVAMAGNDFIADYLSQWIDDVRVVPTGVDAQRFRPSSSDRTGPLTVGWTGTSSNYPSLEPIVRALRHPLDQHDAELLIVADSEPAFLREGPRRVRFEQWSVARESALVREMDIGIMPLEDSDWARGKCAFKLLQYMASGVPFIASPIGMNNELIGAGAGVAARRVADWPEIVDGLLGHPTLRNRLGSRGRQVVEAEYASQVVVEAIADSLIAASA